MTIRYVPKNDITIISSLTIVINQFEGGINGITHESVAYCYDPLDDPTVFTQFHRSSPSHHHVYAGARNIIPEW